MEGIHGGRAGEGPPAGEQFVEHDAEGEAVDARVDVLAAHLLRAHVAHRAHDHAGLGAAARAHAYGVGEHRRAMVRALRPDGQLFGQAEVEQLHPPIPGEDWADRLHDPVQKPREAKYPWVGQEVRAISPPSLEIAGPIATVMPPISKVSITCRAILDTSMKGRGRIKYHIL